MALGMSVAEAQQRISSREFAEWVAYDRISPFGPERDDLRMGILASLIANVNRDAKKHPKPYKPADFIPEFAKGEKPPQTTEDHLKIIEMMNAAFGGKDERTKNDNIS